MFLAVDGQKKEAPLTLSFSNAQPTGSMLVGDVSGNDTYSRTQSEGVIDELLAVAGFHLFSTTKLWDTVLVKV